MQYFIVQDIVEEDSCKYHFHVACICALSDPQLRIVEERAVTLTRDLPALGYSIALSSQSLCQFLLSVSMSVNVNVNVSVSVAVDMEEEVAVSTIDCATESPSG
jgi:hypothetical protein